MDQNPSAKNSQSECCDSGDCCAGSNSDGNSRRIAGIKLKTLIFSIVILSAVVVAVHSFIRRDSGLVAANAPIDSVAASFAVPCGLSSLDIMDEQFVDNDFAFVILPGDDSNFAVRINGIVDGALVKIRKKSVRAITFTIPSESTDFEQVSIYFDLTEFPVVLALSKEYGSSVIAGEITEENLLKAYLIANKPASSGCLTPCGGADCE